MNPYTSSNSSRQIPSWAHRETAAQQQPSSYSTSSHTKITIAGQVVFDSHSQASGPLPVPLNTGNSPRVTLTIDGKTIADTKPPLPKPQPAPSKSTSVKPLWMEEC